MRYDPRRDSCRRLIQGNGRQGLGISGLSAAIRAMDDEGEDISRRRRMIKSESFVKTRSTSSCATPRYEWRSISWSTHAPVQSPEESSESSNEIGEDTDSDGDTQNLCPPLQSLSVSSPAGEGKKILRKGKNCMDIKLDMGIIERSVPEEDESVDFQQQEKAVGKDKQCTQILGHLFVGGRSVAQNYAVLQSYRITHILNCVGFCCPEYYPKDFHYKTLWLHDTPAEDIICVLYDVFDFLEHVREQAGCQVLVHCSEGVSRSAALVIAYMMWRDRKTYDQAFDRIKSARSSTNPNLGFVFQLMQWQARILGAANKPTLSMYRMAPQSAYDPLYLVPKSVANPSLDALDSRGSFVVQTSSIVYVWKGKSCEKGMVAAADKVAFQLIRYEHAHGPILTVAEGSEPTPFVDAFTSSPQSSLRDSGASSSSGEPETRPLVSIYDTDYDIYSKARKGEFTVPMPVMSGLRGTRSPQTDFKS